MSDAFEKVIFRGRTVDKKTRAFLLEMEKRLGYQLTIVQGSYNPGGVGASGGTHDKGGVVDLASFDWERKVKVAADLGAFVYHRPFIQGLWGEHIHLGIRDHGNLHSTAVRQQQDWDARPPRDGLRGHDLLRGQYHPGKKITFQYPVKEVVVPPTRTRVTMARDELVQAIHSIGEAAALLAATPEERTAARSFIDDLKAEHRRLRTILANMPKR